MEASMAQDDPTIRAVSVALELAKTGKFKDAPEIERELMAQGLSVFDAVALNRPGVRVVVDGACSNGRKQHPTPAKRRRIRA
jgi:hypothetical protein